MTTEQIDIIKSYLEQAENGLSKENPKFDFKREWYDLKSIKGINEFLKDTTSIANTFGPDGYIVIGYDDKSNKYIDTKFKNSGLNDSNEINGLINKRVDRLFNISTEDININNHLLSIIHIPPSIDKPHVIRNYQILDKEGNIREEPHKIFVRNNTNVQPATKYDLELMYYDRKNIIPEYRISLYCFEKSISFQNQDNGICFESIFTIENTGTRTLSIIEIKFIYFLSTGMNSQYEKLPFSTEDLFKAGNLVIKSGDVFNRRITFRNRRMGGVNEYDREELISRAKEYFDRTPFYFKLYNGKIVETKLEFY